MMQDLSRFSSFVGDIYDCVAEPERWTSTLERICRHFDGQIATLGVLDTVNQQTRFGAACGPPEIVVPLVTKYASEMPFYHVIPRMEIDVPVTMDTIYDFYGPGAKEVMYESRLGREWVIPNKVADGLCLALIKQAERIGTLVISTTSERRAISQSDLDDLGFLAPHLRRATTIGDLFELRQEEAALYRSLVDNLSCAVLIVSSNLNLLYANPLGEMMLSTGTLINSSNGFLTFANSLAHNCIQQTIVTGQRNEVALGSKGIGVPLLQSSLPAVAHVLPLAMRSSSDRYHQQAAAAIFVAMPGVNSVSAMEAIAALFGLTAAEKRVASMVAQGLTRADIAKSSGVSDGTVKSQLDAVFDKTQTDNQRELENLIRDLTPPVKPL
jgi:DNA-binding CsgD family transcriptional regulator/PAS domain-containing protein